MIQFNSSIGSSQTRSTVKVWYVGEILLEISRCESFWDGQCTRLLLHAVLGLY